MSLWPLPAAQCNAVKPFYNNRETDTETELGQIRDTHRRIGIVQGQAGRQGTVCPVRVG